MPLDANAAIRQNRLREGLVDLFGCHGATVDIDSTGTASLTGATGTTVESTAGSVVLKNVEAQTTVAGVPARVLRQSEATIPLTKLNAASA